VDIVYFDFRKAFDSVPHQRLLLKLCAYGIQSDLLQWLSDFLIGRKQRVVIGYDTSSWCDVKSGVPQGSILGPILFAIYVNNLPQVVDSLIALFADDTKLYPSITSDLDSTKDRQLFRMDQTLVTEYK